MAFITKLWTGAIVGAGVGWALKMVLGVRHPLILAAVVLNAYGLTYFGVTTALGIGEAKAIVVRVLRVLRLKR
jgi:uncharacterized membrane protein (Fun14 family)